MTTPEDSDAYPSATDDWPRGFTEASWWPLVTAIGAVGFVVGVAVYVVGSSVRAIVNPSLGVAVSVGGLLVTVNGLGGWMYHGFIANYWEKTDDPQVNKYLWGMLLYLPVELALIGAGLLYFAFIYFGPWPPPGDLPPMLTPLVWFMTTLILVSSFTNLFASRALRDGNRRRFLVYLATTPILGIVFLAGKAANWYRLVVQEGYGPESGIYWTAFFSTSGLHGVLVTVGVVMMLVVLARALAGHYSPEQRVSVTTTTMYWWMVDSVWFIIVVELYAPVAICRSAGTC